MKTNIKISIIIACYNVDKYVEQCLDSVINQSYKNLEIIAVNDGSTDQTLSILERCKKFDDRIIVIDQENKGLSGARNSGIDYATGSYLMFIDSDDWINLETIALNIESLNKNESDLILFSYIKEYENNYTEKHILPKNHFYNSSEVKLLHKRIIGLTGQELSFPEHADSIVTAWGKLYKTRIIQDNKLQFVDCKLIGTEDMLFNVYYFNFIKSATYIDKCLYHYRKNNNNSLTSIYKSNFKQQWENLFKLVQDFITRNNLDATYQQALNNRISMSIVSLGLNELFANSSITEKIEKINQIISNPNYTKSISKFQIKYLPFHWKIFFYLVKYRLTLGVFLMLKIMKSIVEKNK